MVTEVKFECGICGNQSWVANEPEECPDCLGDHIETIDERERDESNGYCSVGAPEDAESDVNCQLVAMFEADIESEYEDEPITRKVCEKHKKFWDGSKYVLEFREL